jgi:hypothetical protein
MIAVIVVVLFVLFCGLVGNAAASAIGPVDVPIRYVAHPLYIGFGAWILLTSWVLNPIRKVLWAMKNQAR